MIQRTFEVARLLAQLRKQRPRAQRQLRQVGVDCGCKRVLDDADGFVVAVLASLHPPIHERKFDHGQRSVDRPERVAGHDHVGFGERVLGRPEHAEGNICIGDEREHLRHPLGSARAHEFEAVRRESDRQQVLAAIGAQLGHVEQRCRVEVRPVELAVRGQRSLVRHDRAVDVAQAVIHHGDGVEQISFVAAFARRSIQIEGLERAGERSGVVARGIVHAGEQVQRPDGNRRRMACARKVTSLERQSECLICAARSMGRTSQPVQRLRFPLLVHVRAGQDSGMLGKGTRPNVIRVLIGTRVVKQLAHGAAVAALQLRDLTYRHSSVEPPSCADAPYLTQHTIRHFRSKRQT